MMPLRNLLTPLVIITGILAMLFVPVVVHAQCDPPPTNTQEAIQCGSSNTSGVPVTNNPQPALQNVLNDSINFLSIGVAVVAVILIIFSGYRYITSGGDAAKVTSAKNTLIYAIIGLIIAAIAQGLVKFVLNEVDNPSASSAPSTGPPSSTPPPCTPSNPSFPAC